MCVCEKLCLSQRAVEKSNAALFTKCKNNLYHLVRLPVHIIQQ